MQFSPLIQSVKNFFQQYGPARTYWIAYSGGLDSRVLLQLCAMVRMELSISLRAVHINHGLSPNAAQWSAQCAKDCGDLQIDFQQRTIDAKHAVGESPEETARQGRYAVLAELLQPHDVLLTAHQQDDQAETVLLQLFRGAGPKGLAAMSKIKVFAKGFHARPLLNFTREDLKHFAEANQLQWIEDESNLNTGYTRNFLRHDIMPLLKKRWPNMSNTLSRSAENCAEMVAVVEEVAVADLRELGGLRQISAQDPSLYVCSEKMIPVFPSSAIDEQKSPVSNHPCVHKGYLPPLLSAQQLFSYEKLVQTSGQHTLSIKKLLQLTPARQRQALRTWFSLLEFPVPSAIKLKQMQQDFLHAREDKYPHIQWKNVELRRYHDELYLMKSLPEHDPTQLFHWNLQRPLTLPNIGVLSVNQNTSHLKEVIVRFRQGGEVCQLRGRTHHHELKKLLQIWNIPPWERDRVPLIYLDDRLIAVVGYFLDETFFQAAFK